MHSPGQVRELVIKTTKNFMGIHLQRIIDIGDVRFLHGAQRIQKHNTHPSHSLFTLLPSGKRYRSNRHRTNGVKSTFITQVATFLNSP